MEKQEKNEQGRSGAWRDVERGGGGKRQARARAGRDLCGGGRGDPLFVLVFVSDVGLEVGRGGGFIRFRDPTVGFKVF